MQIYNVGTRIVNTYIYPINNAYVMIDTGYDGGYNRFLKRLEKIGIPLEKVKYLFLTHAHDDHAGFLNELLINAPWLTVIISDKSKPVLIRGQNSFEGGLFWISFIFLLSDFESFW